MEGRASKALGRAFRLSLDRLGITHNARKRRRVGREIGRLVTGPLPDRDDYETPIPYRGVGWAREIPELRLWLLYKFDDDEMEVILLVDRRPIRLEQE